MSNTENKYGNDGRTTTLARGLTRGLRRDIREIWKYNHERTTKPHFTHSRNKNYKLNIEYIRKLYEGLILNCTEYKYGKDKDRACVFTVLAPKGKSDDFTFVYFIISFRDPKTVDVHSINLNISKHCLERLYQRYAGNDHPLVFTQLKPVLDFTFKVDARHRHYEIGTGDGMCIADVDQITDEEWQMTAITWVEKTQLRPDQPCEVGDSRIIESPKHE